MNSILIGSFYITDLGFLNPMYLLVLLYFIKNIKIIDAELFLIFSLFVLAGLVNLLYFKQLLIFSLGLLLLTLKPVRLSNYSFNSSVFVLLFSFYFLELAYRINEGTNITIENDWFYTYKVKTFNGEDSNFVGFNLLCITSYLYTIRKKTSLYWISFVFLLLTFSRTAIVSFIIFAMLFSYREYLIKFLILFLPIFGAYAAFDYSFQTKILINYYSIIEFSDQSLPTILFGMGISNFNYNFNAWDDVVGHTVINEVLYGSGLIGFALFSIFVYNIFKQSSKAGKNYLIAVAIAAQSFFPILWFNMAIFYLLIERNQRK